jgi:glutathione synthase/RimK-type ligase-like ATP-grasp enzyme
VRDMGQLKIPRTIVSTSRQSIIDYFQNNERIIAKPLGETLSLKEEHCVYSFYYECLTLNQLEKLPDSVFPCIIQEYIDKLYDIRVFCLGDSVYPFCMLSQRTLATTNDSRNSDEHEPMRMNQIVLPSPIMMGINGILHSVGMNTASIDMVMDRAGNYYFLELNSVGQFEYYAETCGINISREIAQYLYD